MPAYLVSAIEIHDKEGYNQYVKLARHALEPFKFKRLSIDPSPIVYEGQQPANHLMIAEFESLEDIDAFYNSAAYQKAIKVRQASSTVKYLMAMKAPEPKD